MATATSSSPTAGVRLAAVTPTDRQTARAAGALLASGVIALVVTGLAASALPGLARVGDTAYRASGVAMTISDVALLIGVVLLSRTEMVRPGALRTVGFGLAIAGSVGAVVGEVILRLAHDAGNAVFQVVGPVQALGLIVVGVGTILTRAWTSWRRWTPLALGLYVPVVLVPSLAASGGENLPALAGYHTLVTVLGVAAWIQSRRLA